MSYFKYLLATGQTYHVFNRSIIGREVYKDSSCFLRFIKTIWFYKFVKPLCKLSHFLVLSKKEIKQEENKDKSALVDILCYCIMPNHFHLVLTQVVDKGISIYMNRVLNSYSRYFNTKYKRKGPLWEGRFQRNRVDSDEGMFQLSRYVHLNPVASYLVKDPRNYPYSSYLEYLQPDSAKVSNPRRVLGGNYSANKYEKFVLAGVEGEDNQKVMNKFGDLFTE